jgi:hypothetical protein
MQLLGLMLGESRLSLKYAFHILLIVLSAWTCANSAPARAAEAKPCSKISWGYADRMESQGFLGILTPKPDWQLVREALNAEIHELPLARFCQYLLDKGIRQITLACRADTIERDNDEQRVFANCLTSTHLGTADSQYSDYFIHRLGTPGFSDLVSEDRHRDVADSNFRKGLYRKAIFRTIQDLIVEERAERIELNTHPFDAYGDEHPLSRSCVAPDSNSALSLNAFKLRIPRESRSEMPENRSE